MVFYRIRQHCYGAYVEVKLPATLDCAERVSDSLDS